ncbi:hypothetical protein D9M68_514540 [compost metagenome]
MRPRQHPAAQRGVAAEDLGIHQFKLGRQLHVAQLAHVEVPPERPLGPAQEQVAGRLHQALALDHAAPLVRRLRPLEETRHHRARGFLDLQEQRLVMLVDHQQDHAARADAADPDHLEGLVVAREMAQQPAPVGRQRRQVVLERLFQRLLGICHGQPVVARIEQRLLATYMEDGGRRVQDPPAAFHAFGQLGQQRFVGTVGRALDAAADALLHIGRTLFLQQPLEGDAVVPGVEHAHLRVGLHPVPVAAHRVAHQVVGGVGGMAQMACGHHEAGAQPLQVPLPRTGAGFVEIIEVEQQRALRRGIAAEVAHMGVAADLHGQARVGRAGEIVRLDDRSAAVEGERRFQHAAVAQRDQAGHAPLAADLEQRDRIAVQVARRLVRAAWHLLPDGLAAFEAGPDDILRVWAAFRAAIRCRVLPYRHDASPAGRAGGCARCAASVAQANAARRGLSIDRPRRHGWQACRCDQSAGGWRRKPTPKRFQALIIEISKVRSASSFSENCSRTAL